MIQGVYQPNKTRDITGLVNLQALRKEIDDLYSVKVKFDKEPPIWRKQE